MQTNTFKMKTVLIRLMTMVAGVMISAGATANGLNISKAKILSCNIQNHTARIEVKLKWENFWNDDAAGGNHDAVWLFAKYKVGSGNWNHVTLSTGPADFEITVGTVETVDDGKGIFIVPPANLTSNVFETQLVLLWRYGDDGVDDEAENVKVSVFGIEMVYIPEGDFFLGDADYDYGGSSVNGFVDMTGELPVVIGETPVMLKQDGTNSNAGDEILENGILVSGTGGIDTDGDGVIDNPEFPTGYKAFYIMKYEISQGQYAAFLNHIPSQYVQHRYDDLDYGYSRFTITGSYPQLYSENPEVACNFISWEDGSAYADWAGLRPMTEMEYEKACRGPVAEHSSYFPWGSDESSWPVYGYDYYIDNFGTGSEKLSNVSVNTPNINYDAVFFYNGNEQVVGPLRCGIFAASALNKTMIETGATYYGVMEMLGNLFETCISAGTGQGRAFTGANGDGILGVHGEANTPGWPLWANGQMNGYGSRGGNFLSGFETLPISARYLAAYAGAGELQGFRCVRSVN